MQVRVQKSQLWKDGLADWVALAKNAKAKVIADATRDCFELATSTQPSVKQTGGSFQEGFLAIDTGELYNSQRVTVNGQTTASGPGAATSGVPDRVTQRSDVALVFDAPHARLHEYGQGPVPGRFFVRNAVQQWLRIVDAVIQRNLT